MSGYTISRRSFYSVVAMSIIKRKPSGALFFQNSLNFMSQFRPILLSINSSVQNMFGPVFTIFWAHLKGNKMLIRMWLRTFGMYCTRSPFSQFYKYKILQQTKYCNLDCVCRNVYFVRWIGFFRISFEFASGRVELLK